MVLSDHDQKMKDETRRRQLRFLDVLRGADGRPPGTVRDACRDIGATRRTISQWRLGDPVFDEEYKDAMEDGTDSLEAVANTRAVEGVVTRREYDEQGNVTSEQLSTGNDMLKMVLAGRRPMYRGADAPQMVVNVANVVEDGQLARALALLMAQAKSRQLEQV